ncbi:MAG TPA: cytochrome c-type biogenesis protein CcmH, partial [Thermomicrobiales bacterium]|nr:cytochrome c-type biogenesis protein CcmH [Thermomicrobiales bacterium]
MATEHFGAAALLPPQSWGEPGSDAVADRGAIGRAAPGGPLSPSPRRSRLAPPRIGGLGGPLRLLLALLLACTLGGALAGAARADALDDEVRQIAEQLRCPVCQGETVADSQAPISV